MPRLRLGQEQLHWSELGGIAACLGKFRLPPQAMLGQIGDGGIHSPVSVVGSGEADKHRVIACRLMHGNRTSVRAAAESEFGEEYELYKATVPRWNLILGFYRYFKRNR